MAASIRKPLAVVALAALLAAVGGTGSAQEPGSAYRAGLNIARQRDYPNPHCFAQIFARHARPHQDARRGHWVATASRAYQGELWSRCGISR
ncbi:MAG: hypothetical protein J0I54_06705 [Bosea sp.]|uniref:hypothetical protein n=1 Tax=unclassified Bosea (in: a-proteobacteria) TaxID=2653178 RepID=UPI000959846C|nr:MULTISPECIES: hypothetical protein [unclassified Bosea (in: a-proteobacteria)]MBN9456301.1 hypothetical protein [Bosea sp. (in: a-proteobacteria)]OJV05399.1 MAG: hypothetical protein BGO20_14005 [Bosea sp. 67-29]